MSTPILPFAVWASGTNQNSIPANDNSLRNQILNGMVISKAVTAQPGTPGDGDIYILAGTHTGSQWAGFDEDDLVIYSGGTWYAFAPVQGVVVNFEGSQEQFTGSAGWDALSGGGGGSTAWGDLTGVPAPIVDLAALTDPGADRLLFWDDSAGEYTHLTLGTNLSITGTTLNGSAGSTQGKQAIYVAAGSMRPSTIGGCAALATVGGATDQPDKVTLDFDPTTQEYAQFSIVMPKKWDEGTITFVPQWSHGATATNFGVVWNLQGVACSNDDTIAVNFGTAQTSTDTGGTTDDIYMGPESSAVTIAGTPAAEDIVFFRLSRVTGDGSDTMAVDARLHGITVYVTTNADTDA